MPRWRLGTSWKRPSSLNTANPCCNALGAIQMSLVESGRTRHPSSPYTTAYGGIIDIMKRDRLWHRSSSAPGVLDMVEPDEVSPLACRSRSWTHKYAAPDELAAIIVYPASESSKNLDPEKCENACEWKGPRAATRRLALVPPGTSRRSIGPRWSRSSACGPAVWGGPLPCGPWRAAAPEGLARLNREPPHILSIIGVIPNNSSVRA